MLSLLMLYILIQIAYFKAVSECRTQLVTSTFTRMEARNIPDATMKGVSKLWSRMVSLNGSGDCLFATTRERLTFTQTASIRKKIRQELSVPVGTHIKRACAFRVVRTVQSVHNLDLRPSNTPSLKTTKNR